MEYSITNKLYKVKQLKDEGKFTEALQIVNELEKKDILSLQEQTHFYHLKGSLLFEQGYMDEALIYAERAYKSSQQLNEKLLIIDALLIKTNIFRYSSRFTRAFDTINEAEQILKTLDDYSKVEFKERSAYILQLKSYIYCATGDLELALKYGEESSQLAKELNNKRLLMHINGTIGVIYGFKGEVDTSLKYAQYRLKLAKEIRDKQNIIGALNNIGYIYRDKGDFNQALKYLKESLEVCEEIHSFKTPAILDTYCQLAIEMDSYDIAQECLEILERFQSRRDKGNLFGYDAYDMMKAKMLKKSQNNTDKLRARELFLEQLKIRDEFEAKAVALFNLCDLELNKLHQTNDVKVIDEINLYIQQLLGLAKEQKSYWLLAQAYLFQSKLRLITFEFEEAQQLLKEALHIAEKTGQDLAAKQIRNEQENLFKTQSKWNNLKKSEANLKLRLDLSGIDDQIKRMLKKRTSLNRIV